MASRMRVIIIFCLFCMRQAISFAKRGVTGSRTVKKDEDPIQQCNMHASICKLHKTILSTYMTLLHILCLLQSCMRMHGE
jgi:hypothetical protein